MKWPGDAKIRKITVKVNKHDIKFKKNGYIRVMRENEGMASRLHAVKGAETNTKRNRPGNGTGNRPPLTDLFPSFQIRLQAFTSHITSG